MPGSSPRGALTPALRPERAAERACRPSDNGLMPTSKSEFSLKKRVIEFEDPVRPLFSTQVQDTIINSITDHTTKLRKWKVRVARAVKEKRGQGAWSPHDRYAVTLKFHFHPGNHGHQLLDVENFVKPVIDAVAAGLFCSEQTNPGDIQHWNFDDSNFSTLLIHRGPDAPSQDQERVNVFVSSTRRP